MDSESKNHHSMDYETDDSTGRGYGHGLGGDAETSDTGPGGDLALTNNGLTKSSRSGTSGKKDFFLLSINGRIEGAEIFGVNEVYCKWNVVYGPDWQITTGTEEGISQITEKDNSGKFIWNFPIELTFKSTNPHGWPQLVLSVYGSDLFGNHVARGYGSTHVPLSHGSFTKIIPLFVPESSTILQKNSSWLVGRRPEFIDPKIVAQSEGRQIVRVNSTGHGNIKLEIIMKDFAKLGYTTSNRYYGQDVGGNE